MANPIEGPGCTGYISSRPDVVVDYDAGSWDLTVSAASESDLTLVVRDPHGSYYCDDDSGAGANPMVTIESPGSGRYAIWAGVFSENDDIVDGVVGVSEVGNEVSLDGSVLGGPSGLEPASGSISGAYADPLFGTLTLTAGFADDPRLLDVNAGGVDANPLDGPGCVGNLAASQPDAVVDYDTGGTLPLTISATAEVDLSLVVMAPSGAYYCDDDSGNGLNPRIDFDNPESGAYRVWVGTFSAEAGVVASVLGVSEVGVEADGSTGDEYDDGYIEDDYEGEMYEGGPASGSIPGAYADPLFGTHSLPAGFSGDPRLFDVNAGGVDANPLDGFGCVGNIAASQPDVVIDYAAGSLPLTISAASEVDLSLVVMTPSGAYFCDDDSGEGLNPRIDVDGPESGAYRVWVGTFSSDAGVVASVLGVSELGREAE